jgi:cytochrome P450
LAVYPEEQERLYQEVCEICPDLEAEMPYSLYNQFIRAQAIVNESLRMYPVVQGIPKMVDSAEDVVVPTTERGPLKGEPIVIPKGTYIFLDVMAVHHDRTCSSLRVHYIADLQFLEYSRELAGSRGFQPGSVHRHR